MIQLQFAFLAQSVEIRTDGLISATKIGQGQWGVPEVPCTISAALGLSFRFAAPDAERSLPLQVTLVDADGNDLKRLVEGFAKFSKAKRLSYGRLPVAMPLMNMTFPDYGNYALHLYLDGELITSIPIEIAEQD